MNLVCPHVPIYRLPAMLRLAAVGALVAGPYEAIHDQPSYTLGPDYFTRRKFPQFMYADFGWPPRIFAAEVGFLATWWAGLFAGWSLARAGLVELPAQRQRSCLVTAAAPLRAAAVVGRLVGTLIGPAWAKTGDLGPARGAQEELSIGDLQGFVVVSCLHGGGYGGAFLGLIGTVVHAERQLCAGTFTDPSSFSLTYPDGWVAISRSELSDLHSALPKEVRKWIQ
ncbi:MAG: hypothetical protein NZ700_16660 [Gemmataceae bacterium]|nr:hypothetical protein [Gemmataceae bacterium]MDW8264596.1 hypothetical protein [Gemmataceae bacterium]